MKIRSMLTILMVTSLTCLNLEGCATRAVYVKTAPPAKRADVRPARPFAKAVWIAGFWRWNGNKYVWLKSKWVKPQKGFKWVPGHWKNSSRGYRWIPGHWK
ncbi:YXWGXW repeat-containing protein [candidate division KSB1 bacterium]|nr:YXWGXW repeat-containing protein [candidate division KSB1 bacterium]